MNSIIDSIGTENFKINWLPQKHIVDRYLETVKTFEAVNDGAVGCPGVKPVKVVVLEYIKYLVTVDLNNGVIKDKLVVPAKLKSFY